MKYTELTKKAMQISYKAHEGQYDKGGVPYVFHPFHVAEQMDTEDEICVALLHDVIEDTDCSIKDLERAGFPDNILEAVKCLTKDKNIKYMDYILKVKSNPLAKKIKLADIEHNSDISRMKSFDDKTVERLKEKYKLAKEELERK